MTGSIARSCRTSRDRVMLERGLLPDFSAAALAELDRIQSAPTIVGEPARDLRDLLWASIDNDDSRDLDQLTVAEASPGGKVKILVAVADVDALVKDGSAIDDPRPSQHYLGVYGGPDISHASREAFHQPHVPESRRGAPHP